MQLSNPLNTLNPYTRSQGCAEGITFLCDWISKEYHFEDSVVINADGDGILDTIFSINTIDGPLIIYITQDLKMFILIGLYQ